MTFRVLLIAGLSVSTVAFAESPKEPTFGDKPLSKWVQDLDDKQFDIRWEARKAIKQIGPDALSYLSLLLDGLEVNKRILAATALSEIKPISAEVKDKMVRKLRDDSEQVRFRIAMALGKLGPDGKDAVPVLTEFLKSKDKATRLGAIEALSDIGPNSSAAVSALIELLDSDEDDVRVVIAGALGNIGAVNENVVPALLRALKHKRAEVRVIAAEALGEIGPPAKDALFQLEDLARGERAPLARETFETAIKNIKKTVN